MTKIKKLKKTKPKAPEPAVGPFPRSSAPRTISSPFYPAVTPHGTPQEARPTPAPPPNAHRKAKVAASWAAKATAVIVTAALSGISSYRSSKADQEGGYESMAKAVVELQNATKELIKQVAYLQGEMAVVRGEAARLHGKTVRKSLPSDLKTSVTLSKLPIDFAAAVRSQGRPTERVSYSMGPVDEDGISVFDVNEKAILDEVTKKRALAVDEMKKRTAKTTKKEETLQKAAAMERVVPVIVAPEPPSSKVEAAAPPD